METQYVGKAPVLFLGVIEDRNDPMKANRVRVRIYYWHTDDKTKLPTKDLPWVPVAMPTTEGSISGIGVSPHGLVEGSWVMGFFMDGATGQAPIITHSIPGIPTEAASPRSGFNDPSGTYPRYINEPDVNRVSRNESETLSATKNASRITGINKATGGSWDQPVSPYAAQYPYNKVQESESGHFTEIDDTPGQERLHKYHKTGTFEEIDKNGNRVTKIIGDDYEIVVQDKNVYIAGSCNLTIAGNVATKIDGDWTIEVAGSKTEIIHGSHTQTVSGKSTATWQGKGSNITCNNGLKNIGLITHGHPEAPSPPDR
jgi:hypothetical protein